MKKMGEPPEGENTERITEWKTIFRIRSGNCRNTGKKELPDEQTIHSVCDLFQYPLNTLQLAGGMKTVRRKAKKRVAKYTNN
jgi:hypothetical protein